MNTISPTRRSPRDHIPQEAARERVIHEPPPNAQVILAQQAIRDNDLVALHEALTSCKGAWFSRGVYLLHYAASNGASAECIDTLVTRAVVGGNSIDAYNDQRRSALFCACEFNHLAAAAKLVELGAKVEKCDTMGNTPLIIAVTKNFPQVAAMLLDNHADIHAQSEGGSSPLHRAAKNGALECVKLLIERGAFLERLNNLSKTPLDLAGTEEVVEYLEGLINNGRAENTNGSPNKNNNSIKSPRSRGRSSPLKKSSPPKKRSPTKENNNSSSSNNNSNNNNNNYNNNNTNKKSPRSSAPISSSTSEKGKALTNQSGVVKQEHRVKRLKVDDEISFRVGSPYSPVTPPPTSTTTTTTSTTAVPQPEIKPILQVQPAPEVWTERVLKVKRREDELFWEVRVPANCTYANLFQMVTKKTGVAFKAIAKGNVRVADDEDVERLPNECELALV